MPPAARQGDKIMGVDIHIIMIPSPAGEVPTPLPHPYAGTIASNCSTNVKIGGMAAATVGSQSSFSHIPQGPRFQVQPTGIGVVQKGSATVKINGKPAARVGDICKTCFDIPGPPSMVGPPGGTTVMIGG